MAFETNIHLGGTPLSSIVIGNILVENETSVAYRITDIYNQHYWTDPIG